MSEYKSPAFVLASVDAVAIVAVAVYFKKKNEELATKIENLEADLKKTEKWLQLNDNSKVKELEKRIKQLELGKKKNIHVESSGDDEDDVGYAISSLSKRN